MDKLLVWTHVHILEANVPQLKWIYHKAKSSARQYNRPRLLALLVSAVTSEYLNYEDASYVLVKK